MRHNTHMERYRAYALSLLSIAALTTSSYIGGVAGCGGSGGETPAPVSVVSTPPSGTGTDTATGSGTGANDASGSGTGTGTGTGTSTTTPDVIAPTVSSVDPIDVSIDVAINHKIVATFSEGMDPLTLSASTFMVTGPGATPVTGTVDYASVGNTATFTPASNLDASTLYTVTITTGSKDIAGNALASNYVWSFTTGVAADIASPTIIASTPADAGTGVVLNQAIATTFSEAMKASTITTDTYTLEGPGAAIVTGTVDYNLLNNIATFTPGSNLAPDTLYTATITTGVQDLAGNALLVNMIWSFTTGSAAAAGPAAVNLGTAGNFVILSKTGVSTTGVTAIVGDIGLSPAAASFITGFDLIADFTNTFSTSALVTGKVYASDYAAPTPAIMTTAVSDMQAAFTDAAGRTLPDFTELFAGDISGQTLIPGLYKWGTGVMVTDVGVTLSGGANDVWIFQIAQDLTVNNSAIITLIGGAQAKNIFWQVAGQVTLGTAADFKGIILSQTLISLNTGAVMTGRALAQTEVTLDANQVTAP